MVNKSERQTQRTLRKLTAIGVITELIEGNRRKYIVNWDLLRTKDISKYINNNKSSKNADDIENVTLDVTPANFANTVNIIIYPQNHGYTNNTGSSTNNIVISTTPNIKIFGVPISDAMNANNTKENLISRNTPETEATREEKEITVKVDAIKNLNHPTQLDPIEVEIKQEFETVTGNKLNIKRDNQALKELKEISIKTKNIVLEAFKNVQQHLSETKGKIYSLSYVLVAAKNLLHAKTRPKKDNLSPEDKRNLEVGGNLHKYDNLRTETLTPEQLQQASKDVQARLHSQALRTQLFNNLEEDLKNELIQEEIAFLKSQPIWEKIKPTFPWFYHEPSVNHAVDNIKDYLLKEHLDYQAFISSPDS